MLPDCRHLASCRERKKVQDNNICENWELPEGEEKYGMPKGEKNMKDNHTGGQNCIGIIFPRCGNEDLHRIKNRNLKNHGEVNVFRQPYF